MTRRNHVTWSNGVTSDHYGRSSGRARLLRLQYAGVAGLLGMWVGPSVSREPILHSLVRRLLVIRNDRIGDLVLTSPFLRELRRNFPSSHITLLVAPAS